MIFSEFCGDPRTGAKEIFAIDPGLAVDAVKAATRFGIDGSKVNDALALEALIAARRKELAKVFRRVVDLIDPCARLDVFDPLESSKEAVALLKALEAVLIEATKERQIYPSLLRRC